MSKTYVSKPRKDNNSVFSNTYTSFSGSDIVACFKFKDGKPRIFGSIQTVSYSTYRPSMPVHTLGRANARGIVRGARTIAGSLIFTVFDRHVLTDMLADLREQKGKDTCPLYTNSFKADEIPPFDIIISFLNEYGESSKMVIYDVHLISEGQTMSVEDIIVECTFEFIAGDIQPMSHNFYEEPSKFIFVHQYDDPMGKYNSWRPKK
ncbi:MAG: virion structural protein [Bacilli bacterium]